MNKLLIIVSFVLFGVGCASAPYSAAELTKADDYIKEIRYETSDVVNKECYAWKILGCSRFDIGVIYIDKYLPEKVIECVVRHEKSHFYEMFVKKVPYEDTWSHKGWRAVYCEPIQYSTTPALF